MALIDVVSVGVVSVVHIRWLDLRCCLRGRRLRGPYSLTQKKPWLLNKFNVLDFFSLSARIIFDIEDYFFPSLYIFIRQTKEFFFWCNKQGDEKASYWKVIPKI